MLIVGVSPELKFRTTDESDTAHVVSGLPIARKPWYSVRHSAYFESMPSAYAADVFINPCISPYSGRRVPVRQKWGAVVHDVAGSISANLMDGEWKTVSA